MMQTLYDIVTIPYVSAWLGAICVHTLSLYSDEFKGTQPFLRKMFPDRSDKFYVRLDFFLLPMIGALLSVALLEPNSMKNAFFAGLSWSGSLMAFLNNKK